MYIRYECCRDCKPPKRKPACHDTCPDYKEVHDANTAIKEKKKMQRKIDSYTVESCIKRNEKWRKDHKR